MTDDGRRGGSGAGNPDDPGPDGFDADDWFARAFGAPEPPPVDPAIEGPPHPHDALPPTEAMPFETAHLAEVSPDAADAPAFEFPPTQAMDVADLPAEPEPAGPPALVEPPPFESPVLPPAVAEPAPTQAMDASDLDPAPADAHRDPTSAIDKLFADHRFREYEPGADPSEVPWANRPTRPPAQGPSAEMVRVPVRPPGDAPPPDGPSRTQKILLATGGSLLALLSLAALFLLGTRLPDILGPAPAAVRTPSATPSPSPVTVLPIGPVEPGVYAWDELLGGECLDPFADPWAEEFTVVDCAQPHPAQLVYRGLFPEAPDGVYPGAEALEAQIPILCTAPGVVDLAAAGQYTDAVIQGSFPVTEEQWALDRSYYCFVSRSSGEPLSGSIAVPQAPPAG